MNPRPSPGDFELDLYLPISGEVQDRSPVDVVPLPGGPAARTTHRGAYDETPAAYEAVLRYVTEVVVPLLRR
ncbi:hypothetical protein [Lentzea sp. NPDC055074]